MEGAAVPPTVSWTPCPGAGTDLSKALVSHATPTPASTCQIDSLCTWGLPRQHWDRACGLLAVPLGPELSETQGTKAPDPRESEWPQESSSLTPPGSLPRSGPDFACSSLRQRAHYLSQAAPSTLGLLFGAGAGLCQQFSLMDGGRAVWGVEFLFVSPGEALSPLGDI